MLKLTSAEITKRYHVVYYYGYPDMDNLITLVHDREQDKFTVNNETITASYYHTLLSAIKGAKQIVAEYDCDILQ